VTNTVISKARSEVEEKIHDAMEAAMAAGGEKTLKEVIEGGASSSNSSAGASSGSSSKGGNFKRKQGSEDRKGPEIKRVKGLWQDELDNLDDEDLSDSSEDEEGDKLKGSL